jgi:signal transduction histidine kinase
MITLDFVFLLIWAGLAVSFYNTLSLIWLGGMVLLIGNRRSAGTWLVGIGLLLGALFFTSHTAILGRGLADTGFGMNFWWWVSWAPAVVAPIAWYASMLWHAGFRFQRGHSHRPWPLLVAGLAVAIVVLIIFANPLPSYHYVAGRGLILSPSLGGIPLLVWAYMAFSILCYLLPLDLLRRREPDDLSLAGRSRAQARPWLVAASVAMLLAGAMLVWTSLWALKTSPLPSLKDPIDERIVQEFDLAVAALIAVAITLLGRSIVAYEVFTGRPLPRDRFYSQWRSTVLLAGGFGALAAFAVALNLRPVYGFLLATGLVAVFYVLYSWGGYAERRAFMDRLRPFVASQNLYSRLTDSNPVEDSSPRTLFDALCRDILAARTAALVPAGALSALTGPPLLYPPGVNLAVPAAEAWAGRFTPGQPCLPAENPELIWAVALWSERGLAGVLFLGEKDSGSPYSEEEIELAQAAGERLIDVLAGSEMARLSLELLRQRMAQARVLEGQSRRVLHDEVLPELHTSVLYLSGVLEAGAEVRQAVETLTAAHRRISDLLRESAPGVPARLAQDGLAAALRLLLEGDLAGEFNRVRWNLQPGAEDEARRVQPFAAEVIYFAARELLRNAARYGRGGNSARPLNLAVGLQFDAPELHLVVEDDGVGLGGESTALGAGSGLRIHTAMLAAVGAELEVSARAEGGTRGVIRIRLP